VLRIAPTVVAMLLASSVQLSAQDLGGAATRERGRRENAVASASKGFTDEDLRPYVETATQLPSGQAPIASGPGPFLHGEAPRQNAYARHRTSAEAYLRLCEERLRAAEDAWSTAREASQGSAATQARRVVESAAGALGRARDYRDQAEVAARVAQALPAGPG
jgi:hypothetical protein